MHTSAELRLSMVLGGPSELDRIGSSGLCGKAADEIERLRKLVADLCDSADDVLNALATMPQPRPNWGGLAGQVTIARRVIAESAR